MVYNIIYYIPISELSQNNFSEFYNFLKFFTKLVVCCDSQMEWV